MNIATLSVGILLTTTMAAGGKGGAELRDAVPREPVDAILAAFQSHPLVALGDDHGNEQIHAFRLALIREPRFAATVNDIVVEFGSAQYQDVMDRFVEGADVPGEILRQAWRNTTQPDYEWDLPIYEQFFRAVRSVNTGLSPARRLRVLLGDPPIDWHAVPQTGLARWVADRDGHAADVIRREVLRKGRRALLIYGGGHLGRHPADQPSKGRADGLVTQLERDGLARVFTINPETHRDLQTVHPAVTAWPVPSLSMLRGTAMGAAAPAGARNPEVRMEDQFNAVLYLGPMSAMTKVRLDRALCADREYMDMRLGRLRMVPLPPGARNVPADRLKEYCANPDGGHAIADSEPQLTERVRAIIGQAAAGTVDPEHIALESRDRLIPVLHQIGARFLKPAGTLESLTLLSDASDAGKRVRRYRAVFAGGLKLLWAIGLSSSGTVVSMEPRPE